MGGRAHQSARKLKDNFISPLLGLSSFFFCKLLSFNFFVSKKLPYNQARIQTVAKVARATVRFFPPRIFRVSPLLDTALRIFKKYILII
jgi:hypothetical protein